MLLIAFDSQCLELLNHKSLQNDAIQTYLLKLLVENLLFTVAKTWKQLKCPLLVDWVKKCGTCVQWNITQP